jgi:hypothetical protein
MRWFWPSLFDATDKTAATACNPQLLVCDNLYLSIVKKTENLI